MRIAVITCHDVYNAGAALQAYALTHYLKGLGHEAYLIDYKPDYLSRHYPLWGVNHNRYDKPLLGLLYCLAKLPSRIAARASRRKRSFDDFTRNYQILSAVKYRSADALKKDPPFAELYIAGSDQIWNPLFQNGRDPAFYLDFAPKEAMRCSYAASFATDSIPDDCRREIKARLLSLDRIGVREHSGLLLLESLGLSGVENIDPVFLLGADEWRKIKAKQVTGKPYLLLYDFDRSEELTSYARRKAREKGLLLYSVFPCPFADKVFDSCGPREFISLVAGCDFAVSNSFHATAFSAIFHRPFAVFGRGEQINARMRDLVASMGIPADHLTPDCPAETPDDFDWEKSAHRLAAKINASKHYLDELLSMACPDDK